jgi:hypothetical protein
MISRYKYSGSTITGSIDTGVLSSKKVKILCFVLEERISPPTGLAEIITHPYNFGIDSSPP